MGLETFFGKRRPPRLKYDDELDPLIDVIEKFAPRDRREDREMYYYNYRLMGQYFKPLLALMETVSQRSRLKEDRDVFLWDLFLRVKAFYDIKDRLSMEAALGDRGLQKRYQDLFTFFYGRKDLSAECLGLIRGRQASLRTKEKTHVETQES